MLLFYFDQPEILLRFYDPAAHKWIRITQTARNTSKVKSKRVSFHTQVLAETTVGYYGICQTISDMKPIVISLPVSGVSLSCPSVVEAWTEFECSLQVATGVDLEMELKTPFGDIYNGTLEGNFTCIVRPPVAANLSKTSVFIGL